MRISFSFDIGKWRFVFKLVGRRKPELETEGIASWTYDHKHVLFFDYDKVSLSFLEREVRYLQDKFMLSDAYIFCTEEPIYSDRGRYHVIILDKMTPYQAFLILAHSSCSSAFKLAPKVLNEYKCWILRYTAKGKKDRPRYVKVLRSPYCEYEQSSWHAEFLRKYYNIDVRLVRPDKLKKGFICSYRTE
jgi:hypothetical protein